MSEYQLYDFLSLDRPLTAAMQAELRQRSTRATITANSFTNVYEWGDLKGDPRRWMEKYFDVFLYAGFFSTQQLMFRFPQKVLSLKTARRYCFSDMACESWSHGSHTVVSLMYSAENFEDHDWDNAETGEARIAGIAPARAEVIEGDLRLLYLGWLLAADSGEIDDDELEPPVPAGLGKLSGALAAVADFLIIDPWLIAAAAEASPPKTARKERGPALRQWITALPEKEKTRLLAQAAEGKQGDLGAELRRRFGADTGDEPGATVEGERSAGELLLRAAQLRSRAG
ncbi:hypothetical protein KIH74_15100 [Kineosporia sp. J2-2]|uniref:Uncharacterized protein n=1 Tax=Kineosporia corallincola TaxID=2835133 RepID=A0ABS5TGS8_9ACTN|nr:hypothetical protein [Kineosporia corallincola]MBT0770267.1 hypothetical protein [Kineosporia corallincola]